MRSGECGITPIRDAERRVNNDVSFFFPFRILHSEFRIDYAGISPATTKRVSSSFPVLVSSWNWPTGM